jgi:hypothetical protein
MQGTPTDPTNSSTYKDEEGAAFRCVEFHIIKGSLQLLPGDVRDVQDHLVETNIKSF